MSVEALEQRAKIFEIARERVLELGFVGVNELVLDALEVTSHVRAEKLCFLRGNLEVHVLQKCITRTASCRREAIPG